jgi:uncharacterized protein (DUF983 family)
MCGVADMNKFYCPNCCKNTGKKHFLKNEIFCKQCNHIYALRHKIAVRILNIIISFVFIAILVICIQEIKPNGFLTVAVFLFLYFIIVFSVAYFIDLIIAKIEYKRFIKSNFEGKKDEINL